MGRISMSSNIAPMSPAKRAFVERELQSAREIVAAPDGTHRESLVELSNTLLRTCAGWNVLSLNSRRSEKPTGLFSGGDDEINQTAELPDLDQFSGDLESLAKAAGLFFAATNIPPVDMAELALRRDLSNHLLAWVDCFCMMWEELE